MLVPTLVCLGSSMFGSNMVVLDDIDGDGKRDIAIADPNANHGGGKVTACVSVVSGKDGHVLFHFLAPVGERLFGRVLLLVPNSKPEGPRDLLIASESAFEVVSLSAGKVLGTGKLEARGDPVPVAIGPDADGDGVQDVVFVDSNEGAPILRSYSVAQGVLPKLTPLPNGWSDITAMTWNAVDRWLVSRVPDRYSFVPHLGGSEKRSTNTCGWIDSTSMRTGWRIDASDTSSSLAFSSCWFADVNGDGRRDLALSRVGEKSVVEMRSGADGSSLWSVEREDWAFGRQLCALGDQDGDGTAELVVSAPASACHAVVYIYSGRDGSLQRQLESSEITRWEEESWFGCCVCPAGDWDGDGREDLCISAANDTAPFDTIGVVRIFSVARGTVLLQVAANRKR